MGEKRVRSLYLFFINLVINYFLLLLIVDSLELEASLIINASILISAIIFQIIWNMFFIKPILFLGPVFVSLLMGIYIYNFHEDIYTGLTASINDFFGWAVRFLRDLTFVHEVYLNILLIIIVLIISFIIHILTYKIKRTSPLIVLGTTFFLYRWFLYSEKVTLYYSFYIVAVLQLYVYRIFIKKEKLWQTSGKKIEGSIFKPIAVYSLIVVLLLVGAAAFLPRNFEPVAWRWLDDKVQKEFPQLSKWRNTRKTSIGYGASMQFDLSFTEYQDSYKRLGGPIEQDNLLLLRVTSDKPTYLKGRVKDMYTGSYWKSTNDDFSHQLASTNIRWLGQEETRGKPVVQRIEHINLTTSTIFNSYIPTRVKLNDHWFYVSSEHEMFSGSLILKNSSYRIFSIEPTIDWKVIKSSVYKPKENLKKYLQIPETIPRRVIDLSKKITNNEKSDYDKVKALVAYLRSSYDYGLSPPETPYNRDFVDYFLFDLKEGYCTYFASSLAIMTRTIGIPSRYVEGFKLPQHKEENKYYNVYSSDAHAWVEVYIEGYGWMIFESTPLYEGVLYEAEEVIKEDFLIPPADELNPKNRESQRSEEETELLERGYVSNTEPMVMRDKKYFGVIKYFLMALLFISLSLLIKILFNLVSIRGLTKREDSNIDDVAISYYLWILNLLRILGNEKDIYETTIEYSRRVTIAFESEIEEFSSVTRIFNKVRYGGEKISHEEFLRIKYCYNKLERKTMDKIGVIRYLYYKYVSMEIYKTK